MFLSLRREERKPVLDGEMRETPWYHLLFSSVVLKRQFEITFSQTQFMNKEFFAFEVMGLEAQFKWIYSLHICTKSVASTRPLRETFILKIQSPTVWRKQSQRERESERLREMQSLQEKASVWSGVDQADAFAIDESNLFDKLGLQSFINLSTNFYTRFLISRCFFWVS